MHGVLGNWKLFGLVLYNFSTCIVVYGQGQGNSHMKSLG